MKSLPSRSNFLGIPEPELCSYKNAKYVIQSVPYEYTSSYIAGSDKGPAAIIKASQYVEFYDEVIGHETYKTNPIATLPPLNFAKRKNKAAIDYITKETTKLIRDGKYVVSLGAEHTVTLGLVQAHMKEYRNLHVLQIDAHADLRDAYHNNPLSHASVMARVHDLGVPLTQIGIRAFCSQEAQLMKRSDNIHTFMAHTIRSKPSWAREALQTLGNNVYLTIDADGFDPSIMPAVGTAEPNGLFWTETLDFLTEVFATRNVVGFDIVECAPMKGQILSEYTLAKLCYRLIGLHAAK